MHLLFASIFFLEIPTAFNCVQPLEHTSVWEKFLRSSRVWNWNYDKVIPLSFFVNLLKYNPIMFSFRIHSEGQNLFWMYANPKCIIMDTITSRNLRKSQTWSLSSFYLGQLIQNKNLFYQYWHMLPLPWFWAFKVSIWSEKYIIKSLTL